jgi:hypothetical protein
MRIEIQAATLVNGLDFITRTVDRQQARKIPLLGSVLIDANSTEIALTSTT